MTCDRCSRTATWRVTLKLRHPRSPLPTLSQHRLCDHHDDALRDHPGWLGNGAAEAEVLEHNREPMEEPR